MNYLQSIVHDTHDKQTSQVIFVMSWKGWMGGKHSTPSYNTRNSRFLPSFHDVNRSLCAELLTVIFASRYIRDFFEIAKIAKLSVAKISCDTEVLSSFFGWWVLVFSH